MPFLRSVGYGGMLIPLVSVIVALTLLPVVLGKLGPRLDWPHVRNDDKASRAWTRWARAVVRRRWLAALGAVAGARGARARGHEPAAGDSRTSNTIAKEGDAKQGLVALERSGIGSGALVPTRCSSSGSASPSAWPQALGGGRRRARRGRAAPSPQWRRPGAAVVDAFGTADASSPAGRDTLDRVRAAAHAAGAGRPPRRAAGARTRTSSKRCTATSR